MKVMMSMGKKSTMVKFILICLLVILVAATALIILIQSQRNSRVDFSAPSNAQVIDAPDKDLHLYLWLDNGVPYYSIVYNNEEIVNASQMGIDTTIGNFSSDFQQIKMLSSTNTM